MGWVSFFQLAEKALWDKICLGLGGGARGGSRPPRMGLNASGALLCKAPGERSEDLSAPVDGTVKSIAVATGATVNTDDLLVVLG